MATQRITYTTLNGETRWFDSSKALSAEESTHFDGRNHVSDATGSQWEHERLYLTAGCDWVLNHWSQWQGSTESYREITIQEAASWLAVNGGDGEIDKLSTRCPEIQDALSELESKPGSRGKSDESNANKTLRFRCTAAQEARIKELAATANLTVSEYLLSKIL